MGTTIGCVDDALSPQKKRTDDGMGPPAVVLLMPSSPPGREPPSSPEETQQNDEYGLLSRHAAGAVSTHDVRSVRLVTACLRLCSQQQV